MGLILMPLMIKEWTPLDLAIENDRQITVKHANTEQKSIEITEKIEKN